MSGWKVPVKDTYYPLKSNTFYITTESVTGGSDVVNFILCSDSRTWISYIALIFRDWTYGITYCTPGGWPLPLKFPVTPPTAVKKTWEITFTTEALKIKCNTLQVLHFILNNTHHDQCIAEVKGKIARGIKFYGKWDTATKMFNVDQVGK